MDASGHGPWQLVAQVHAWALASPWCVWLELGGSLGRGAGDELSDVDAGLGVTRADAVPEVLAAMLALAPAADSLVQPLGELRHVIVQYVDGRQLSLVVFPAHDRPGLPPGAIAVMDKTGQLEPPWQPESATAGPQLQREWAFLAWWALRDTAKHAARGKLWRGMASLNEAREHAWRLHAADLGVPYPVHGAVSVQNAGLPAPAGLSDTLPADLTAPELLRAARALADVLELLTSSHHVAGVAAAARDLLQP